MSFMLLFAQKLCADGNVAVNNALEGAEENTNGAA
jgi:hypothetical protein